MWEFEPSAEFIRRQKRWPDKYRRELRNMLDNLDTYLRALREGAKPLQIKFGFVHPEPSGAIAVDQRGEGKGLKQTRLYAYAEQETSTLHGITLGDKGTQRKDVQQCKEFIEQLRKRLGGEGE
jgi:hypothetical protein